MLMCSLRGRVMRLLNVCGRAARTGSAATYFGASVDVEVGERPGLEILERLTS